LKSWLFFFLILSIYGALKKGFYPSEERSDEPYLERRLGASAPTQQTKCVS